MSKKTLLAVIDLGSLSLRLKIFELGDKYSKTMGATYSDENGKEQFVAGVQFKELFSVGFSYTFGQTRPKRK